MNLRQLLLILRLRWWLVLLVLLLSLGGTLAATLLMPKQYTAETSLLLDIKTDPLLATLMPAMATPAYIATQTEIIRSDRVAGRVVSMLGLAQSPSAVAQWREETEGRVPLESYFGSLLQRGLVVEPGKGSTLLNVSFSGTDPKFAAAAANTFAKAYMDLTVELKLDPAKQYSSFFDDRFKTLRTDLENAQARLSAFQQNKGIIVSAERMDQETARLNALEVSLAGALAESADTSSRQRNAGTETSVDVQQSAIVQGLKSELAKAQTKLSEISSVMGSQHPQRLALEAQISELRQQISAEMRRVSGATSSMNRITGQKIAELRSMVDAQKRTVLNLRAQRDEAAVLLKDLETAQRAYDQVATRRSQLSLESQADQVPVRVLSPAVEPLRPSKPNLPKNMVAALVVGLILGVAAAAALEMVDRRVRSEADLLVMDGVPVLGVLSSKPSTAWYGRRAALGMRTTPPRLTLDAGGLR